MGIIDVFRKRKTKIDIAVTESEQELRLALNFFAIQSAINIIASSLANCEFETVEDLQKVKKSEYYLWNIEPNPNQNKVQFLSKLVNELIWHNECLIIENRGYLYIADSFAQKESALYSSEFTNVTIKNLTLKKKFSAKDVLYLTYNDEDITALLNALLNGYRNLITMSMGKYKRAGGRKAVVESGLNPQQDEAWNKALADLYGDKFKKFFENENALVVMPTGQKYNEISGESARKSASDVTDIINLTNEVISQVGRAFKVSPSLLKGEIADLEQAMESTFTFAVKPIVELLEAEIIRKRYGFEQFNDGTFLQINTGNIRYFNPFSVADKADKLIADSVYNPDEIRVKFGEVPLNTKSSTEYVRTKNYEKAEGGETSEK